MGANSRDKGHGFERRTANYFKSIGFKNAKRGRQEQSGEYCPDVIGTPFFIECKSYKTSLPQSIHSLHAKYSKQRDKYNKSMPVIIVTKLNNQGEMVSISMEDFLELLCSIYTTENMATYK